VYAFSGTVTDAGRAMEAVVGVAEHIGKRTGEYSRMRQRLGVAIAVLGIIQTWLAARFSGIGLLGLISPPPRRLTRTPTPGFTEQSDLPPFLR